MNSKFSVTKRKLQSSPTVKLLVIGAIILILLIPSAMIKSIISEREHINRSAVSEVNDKWAHAQVITGPVLTIPFTEETIINQKVFQQKRKLHVLPESLSINGEVTPKELKRGIYKMVVYTSDLNISGSFDFRKLEKLIREKDVQLEDAFLTLGISDTRGIQNQLELKWTNQTLDVEPGSAIDPIISSGVTVKLPLNGSTWNESKGFSMNVKLNGSTNLSFTPVGGITNIEITSAWPSPSFNGTSLPDERNVTEDGFTANWNTLELNRNYPQSWIDDAYSFQLHQSNYGFDLFLPIDDYRKSMRSAKYMIMVLSLTFLIFFLVEVINGKHIHPMQYSLVGLALCLFYILLVSISEHSNFNFAYWVSAAAITIMISLYSLSIFHNRKLSLSLSAMLLSLYGILFVTLQLVDYSLILGAIGLAIILSLTMYFTRNIDWNFKA